MRAVAYAGRRFADLSNYVIFGIVILVIKNVKNVTVNIEMSFFVLLLSFFFFAY